MPRRRPVRVERRVDPQPPSTVKQPVGEHGGRSLDRRVGQRGVKRAASSTRKEAGEHGVGPVPDHVGHPRAVGERGKEPRPEPRADAKGVVIGGKRDARAVEPRPQSIGVGPIGKADRPIMECPINEVSAKDPPEGGGQLQFVGESGAIGDEHLLGVRRDRLAGAVGRHTVDVGGIGKQRLDIKCLAYTTRARQSIGDHYETPRGVLAGNPGDPAGRIKGEEVVIGRDPDLSSGGQCHAVDPRGRIGDVVCDGMGAHLEGMWVESDDAGVAVLLDNIADPVKAKAVRWRPQEQLLVGGQRGVNDNGQPAKRGSSLNVGDEIRGDLDAFLGRPEDEVTGMENKLTIGVNDGL